MAEQQRRVLISGASHTGKSTLAKMIAGRVSATIIATDALARHPGRPWPKPRPHVVDYFSNLSGETHITLLQHHYLAMRAVVRVALEGNTEKAVIVEGSPLRPGVFDADVFVGLIAPPPVLEERIFMSCNYVSLPQEKRQLVDAFLARSLADQDALKAEADAAGVPLIDSSDTGALAKAISDAVAVLG